MIVSHQGVSGEAGDNDTRERIPLVATLDHLRVASSFRLGFFFRAERNARELSKIPHDAFRTVATIQGAFL